MMAGPKNVKKLCQRARSVTLFGIVEVKLDVFITKTTHHNLPVFVIRTNYKCVNIIADNFFVFDKIRDKLLNIAGRI